MLRPKNFGFNVGTKNSNPFQNELNHEHHYIRHKALSEFDEMVETLDQYGIAVSVFDDCMVNNLPDAVFINNWLTIMPNKHLYLFPMAAESRRGERRIAVIESIKQTLAIEHVIDWSHHEEAGLYLESTGSIVFDYEAKVAFASISSRTNEQLFNQFCNDTNFQSFSFNSVDLSGTTVYHTNIMLSIARKFAIICPDCIENSLQRAIVIKKLMQLGKQVIEISLNQMVSFAGNCMEVFDKEGQSKLVMSRTGYASLKPQQVTQIELFSQIVLVNVSIIERVGGGSARCMMLGIPSFDSQ